MAHAKYAALILGLLTTWTQLPAEALVVRSCEKVEFHISCFEGSYIDVNWALYGRENGTNFCRINEAVPCGDEAASLLKVREACQGERQCRFDVTNEYFGGDPCLNVGKYLTVDYDCFATVCQRDVYIWGSACATGKFTAWLNSKRLLYCVSNSSSPATNLTWFKDDTEATSLYDYDMVSFPPDGYNRYGSALSFSFWILGKNETVYKCCGTYADNQTDCLGNECASCTLEVLYLEFVVSQTPPGPHSEGDDVTLTCRPDANPEFSSGWFEWRHGSDPEDLKSLGVPTHITGNSTLNLPEIARSQSGWYQCAADDSYYWYYWHPKLSEVIPVVVHYKANITNKERTWIGVNEGYSAVLECLAQGNPAPTVTWYGPNNTPITNETVPDRISVDDTMIGNGVVGFDISSHVMIHPVETSTDYGTYICIATNGIGPLDEHEILLTKPGNPDPPKNLKISGITEGAFTVTWTPGYNGGMVQSFYVNSRKISEDSFPPNWVVLDSSVHSWWMNGKSAYTLYEVAVYSKNVLGASDYTTTNVRTLPNTPDFYNIDVRYNTWQGRVVVRGIPQDGDSETCLRLEGQLGYSDDYAWEVLTGYECMQHDDDFVAYDVSSSYRDMQSRYCHAGLCSRPTIARSDDFYPTQPPTQGPGSSIALIVIGATSGSLVALSVLACYVRKCLGCTKSSPQDELTTSSTQQNSCRTEAINQLYSAAPPTYAEALEMTSGTETDADRPPEYDLAVAPPTADPTQEE